MSFFCIPTFGMCLECPVLKPLHLFGNQSSDRRFHMPGTPQSLGVRNSGKGQVLGEKVMLLQLPVQQTQFFLQRGMPMLRQGLDESLYH